MRSLSSTTLLCFLIGLVALALSAPVPADPKNQKLFDSNNFKNKVRSGAVAAANKDKPQDGRVEGVRTKNGVGQSHMDPIIGSNAQQGQGGPGPVAGTSQDGGNGGGTGLQQQAPSKPPKMPQQGMQRNPSAPSTVQSSPRGARRDPASGGAVGKTPMPKSTANKAPAQQPGNQGTPRDRRGQMAVNGKQRSPFNKEFNSPAQKRTRKGLAAGSAVVGAQQVASNA